MKFLLFIIILAWAQCGNAASPYTLNELRLSFKEGGASHLQFVKEHRGDDDTIAIRMHNNNIDSERYPGSFLPEAAAGEGEFGAIKGEALVTMGGSSPTELTSFPTSKPTFRGSKFKFNSAVFYGVQSIIFEALDDSTSILRRISLHRSSKGRMILHGTLDFTRLFECMQNLEDGSVATRIGHPTLARHFLVSGADTAGFSIQAPVARSPGKAASRVAAGGTPKSKRK